jgi:transcriptional antiterminator RfaH
MINWYVVRTHPLSEAKASEHLQRQGYEPYLPKCRRWVRHARRREMVLRPLFPNDVFVSFDFEQTRWRSIFSTVGVAELICSGNLPTRVRDGVVGAIRDAEKTGLFDYTNVASRLKPGDKVRVARGPFADVVGRFLTADSRDRVRVLLEILGRQAPVDLALSEVDPV